MAEFPEVTLDQIRGAMDDVERRYRLGGHSLREVYSTRRWVAQVTGDWHEEERCYQLWHAAGGPQPGNVWDFESEIERLVLRGDQPSLARAHHLAAPVLTGQVSFSEPPVPIQCLMLMPLARAGPLELAAATYRRARHELFGGERVHRDEYSAMLHEFCALTGNPHQGFQDMKLRVRGFYTLIGPTGRWNTRRRLLCCAAISPLSAQAARRSLEPAPATTSPLAPWRTRRGTSPWTWLPGSTSEIRTAGRAAGYGRGSRRHR